MDHIHNYMILYDMSLSAFYLSMFNLVETETRLYSAATCHCPSRLHDFIAALRLTLLPSRSASPRQGMKQCGSKAQNMKLKSVELVWNL